MKELNIDAIRDDYLNNFLSIEALAKKYNVCVSSMSKYLKANNIIRNNSVIKSKKAKEINKARIDNIIENIGAENLKQFYLIENHTVEEVQEKYNLTNWTASKIIKELGLIKSKNISSSRSFKTKYDKFGDKKSYDNYMNNKRKDTLISKYGSLDNYYLNLSVKCSKAWKKKELNDIETIVKKRSDTCLEKYNYEHACLRPEARLKGNNSSVNLAFYELLRTTFPDYDDEREFIIKDKAYDFKYKNTLIEINPTFTHNSTKGIYDNPPIAKNYHYQKSLIAKESGFRCIHIFDWDDVDKILMLMKEKDKVYARKCKIKEIDKEKAKEFIDKYHLQGYAKDDLRIGLYYNDELISIMTFAKPRYNKNFDYELIRYCSSKNIIGGVEKLFKYFLDQYSPKSIISYCDFSKFDGHTYEKLEFSLERISIDKHWYNPKTKRHITDNFLRQRGFDQLFGTDYGKGTSNTELMIQSGFLEVYDAGQATYIYKNEEA